MKATVRDRHVLLGIRPLDVVAYLRTHGWVEARDSPVKGTWLFHRNGEEYELLTPFNKGFADYPDRVSDILRTLEIVEGRSQLEILTDIASTSFDIIRIRPDRGDAANGFLPIEEGVALIEKARDMVIAAACSEISPREVQSKKKPDKVTEYLKKVNLGQTERGSYVITILSPVPPELAVSQMSLPDIEEDPFERKVTKRLARSVIALREAVERSISEGNFAPFEQSVAHGVSANLCDAIVGLQKGTNAKAISIQTSWSPVRPMEEPELRAPISIAGDATSVLEQASHIFRESAPIEDCEIEGIVVHLDQTNKPAEFAIISAVVDGVTLKVKLALEEKSRPDVIKAYKEYSTVACTGDLVKEGRQYTLKYPRHLKIIDCNGENAGA